MTPLRIAIAGLGTVGTGVVDLLTANADLITARAGRPITVTAVTARSREKHPTLAHLWHDNPLHLLDHADLLVELIGGSEGIAKSLIETALSAGLPVVTANKALLALHGEALATLAARHDAPLAYEAAVAGAIPAIKILREGLAANTTTHLAGILNGTCNYILTRMEAEGLSFADTLAAAQSLGYAEADPAFDIDGIDTAHKLAILAALAFGHAPNFAAIHTEGIRNISAPDIAFARELGYRIKLLGIAEQTAAGISIRVHPAMVPEKNLLASVDGVFNAVLFDTDYAGRIFAQGRGAGAHPTASAVVADLIDIARGTHIPIWGQATPNRAKFLPIAEHYGAYFLRLTVRDQPGVLADVTAILRDHGISLESMLQHGREDSVPIVLVTHETTESAITAALAKIAALPSVLEPPALIRIEPK